MKVSWGLLAAVAWFCLAAAAAAQEQKTQRPCAKAETQLEMNACAKQDLDSVDRELSRLYESIQQRYADRSMFLQRLRAAQRAWLAFRDAQLELKYALGSQRDPGESYGSVWPMCYDLDKAEMTRQRIKDLQAWLTGVGEGEVCTGSIRRPDPASHQPR